MSLAKLVLKPNSKEKSEYQRIKTNFTRNISFDTTNTEEFFDYVEDENKSKDKLEFNLNLLNKNVDEDEEGDDEELSSGNSNVDEFYDAICKTYVLNQFRFYSIYFNIIFFSFNTTFSSSIIQFVYKYVWE